MLVFLMSFDGYEVRLLCVKYSTLLLIVDAIML